MYKRVLVPLDGSAAADRGLGEAIELAKCHGSELLLIHVLDEWRVAAGDIAAVNLESGARALRENGSALLREAESRVRAAGVAVNTVLLEEMGLPVGSCIVQRARAWPADLIVCGTHGRSGVPRLLYGSVAEHILHHTSIPLLLVRSSDEHESSRSGATP